MSALESLGKSLNEAIKKIFRLAIVDEEAIKELVRDLQRSLLQADVNVNLVMEISSKIKERALKESIPPGISRKEHIIGILYEELTRFLGEKPAQIQVRPGKTHVIMLVGIQGSGKTLTLVKIARFYQKRGMKPALICADTFRPGAFEQLKQLADEYAIPVHGGPLGENPESIVIDGLEKFKKAKYDVLLIDTAGRHKNEIDLMDEMKKLSKAIGPDEIMLVVDGTIGQQASVQAKAFKEYTDIGSISVTKLDGSARGGGALSAVVSTGVKIKFIGTGEKVDDIEVFDPESFVGRLLGIGDIKGLLSKVKELREQSLQRPKALLEGKFTLRDMYDQMEALRKMGPLKRIWSMLPGSYNVPEEFIEIAERKLDVWRVIIQSMREEEIENPKMISSSRIKRIARGSGTNEKDVKELIHQHLMMKKLFKSFKRRHALLPRRLGLFKASG
ncbi:MAG: signal recognition particle protein Srp54 [Candidatus Bathyarchaeia archaeon]